jgi:CheY-like chemotaxis protein
VRTIEQTSRNVAVNMLVYGCQQYSALYTPDPTQLSLLEQNGYELVTPTTGSDGLRLFMLQAADAIVLDYESALLDGGIVAAEIKKFKPQIPVVMLSGNLELLADALKCVDALVAKSDGAHFLLGTIRHVLNTKSGQRLEEHKNPKQGEDQMCRQKYPYGIPSIPSAAGRV